MDYILIIFVCFLMVFGLITTCGVESQNKGATFYVECFSTENPLECCTKYTEVLKGKRWDASDFMFGCLKGKVE